MMLFRSIVSRIVALHLVTIAIAAVLIPLALYWLLNQAANSLNREALHGQALTVASFLRPQPDGSVILDIPAEVRPLYAGANAMYVYAVLDSEGKVLLSSRLDRRALAHIDEHDPNDWFIGRRSSGAKLFGVSVPRTVGEQVYWIQVGKDLTHRDVLIDDIVSSFLPHVAWIVLPILLALLFIDILIVRRALKPVHDASTQASTIGPSKTGVRLPDHSIPIEIAPLVNAVNQALDRLEAGFLAQRDFTADMAHELRTPLAILRVRVDSLAPGPARDAMRANLDEIARTTNQILDIAELESFVIAADARADLHAVCSDAVAAMAPLAVQQAKTIALAGDPGPVWVRGHAEALFLAVRNLIENAIRHAPPRTSVDVEVSAPGNVRVLDSGPGIPASVRETIFHRFWRRDRRTGGRGVGLAIVARVAETHGGSISVENRTGGGAVFFLRLPSA